MAKKSMGRIKIARATSTTKTNMTTDVLSAGNPLYEKDTRKLYVGDGVTTTNNLKGITAEESQKLTSVNGSTHTDYSVGASKDTIIYFNNGIPVASDKTIGQETTGNVTTTHPVNVINGVVTEITGALDNDITGNANTATLAIDATNAGYATLALNVTNPPTRKVALLDNPVLLSANSGMQDVNFNQEITGGDIIEIWYISNPNITTISQGQRYSLVSVQIKTCASFIGGSDTIGGGHFKDIGEIWGTEKSSQYKIYSTKISLTAMQKSGPSYEVLYIGQIYKLNY